MYVHSSQNHIVLGKSNTLISALKYMQLVPNTIQRFENKETYLYMYL